MGNPTEGTSTTPLVRSHNDVMMRDAEVIRTEDVLQELFFHNISEV